MKKDMARVGLGVVGNAMLQSFKDKFDITIYDKNKPHLNTVHGDGAIQELVYLTNGPIFISVPTPMNQDGSCNTSIVKSVCKEINDAHMRRVTEQSCYCNLCGICEQVVVIRSTVPPETCDKIQGENPYISVVFNPEFLTECNAVDDFKNQDRIVLGGDNKAVEMVHSYYKDAFPLATYKKCGRKEAEMLKYVCNSFLAVKVIFANQIKSYSEAIGVDYNAVVDMVISDKRMGSTHWMAPGPDGLPGYGGKCFPKDVLAFIAAAKSCGVDFSLLEKANDLNLKMRPEKDWEKISGVLS